MRFATVARVRAVCWSLAAAWAAVAATRDARAQAPAPAPTHAQQVAAAVLPLPAGLRAEAGVVSLDRHGVAHEWRPSRNGMVCLADVPGDSIFDVRCYQATFIPLLYAATRLRDSGIPDSALDAAIDAEIRGGKLRLPEGGTAGYRMYGPLSGLDWATMTPGDAIDAWQSLHLPYRTARDIGLPATGDGIEPFVMASGTWWAHVMIMERALRY